MPPPPAPGASPPGGDHSPPASHSRRVEQLRAGTPSTTTTSTTGLTTGTSTQQSFGAPPTPFNTYCDDQAYNSMSRGSVQVSRPTDTSYTYDDEEMAYEPFVGDTSLGQTLSPSSTRRQSALSFGDVPISTRPVPAPPQITSFSSGDNELRSVYSPEMVRSVSAVDDRPPQKRLNFLRRSMSRTVMDRDTLRLQQLGYDAVLGRDYTFWSSFCISWINIGSIQVSLPAKSWADD